MRRIWTLTTWANARTEYTWAEYRPSARHRSSRSVKVHKACVRTACGYLQTCNPTLHFVQENQSLHLPESVMLGMT